MSQGKAYVIGAGLSGLAASVALASRGIAVEVFEAAAFAGGRCRSYVDPVLDQVIDNGNHLVLSGNYAVRNYLRDIGAQDALKGPERAEFDFVDVKSGARWKVAPNDGPIPLWVFAENRRPPGTKPLDFVSLLALLRDHPGKRIGEVIECKGPLWDTLLRPLLLAALNTEPADSSADLASAVIRETLSKGGQACRPCIATPTLGSAFIKPALAFLKEKGATVNLGARLQDLDVGGSRAASLEAGSEKRQLGPNDIVILAVPPWIASTFVPGLTVPDEFCAIVNVHFKTKAPGAPPMLGVIGGRAEWIFLFESRVSVTISGANEIVDDEREALAGEVWADVARALNLTGPMPVWQIVKERRATFAATPEQNARRPGPVTQWGNLFVAGDWTDTGLPATIEGSIRSGNKAAALALAALSR
ncbi:MAG: hydroxysqualene dehydroxylase HpnE [Alphaproteobacteria bacterium]